MTLPWFLLRAGGCCSVAVVSGRVIVSLTLEGPVLSGCLQSEHLPLAPSAHHSLPPQP